MRRVRAEERADVWELEEGEFFYSRKGQQMYFNVSLPGGCPIWIPIEQRPAEVPGHGWAWDGNIDRPTLSPSINTNGYWHGFVIAGCMVSCPA